MDYIRQMHTAWMLTDPLVIDASVRLKPYIRDDKKDKGAGKKMYGYCG